jgi:hypothetical protein
MPPAITAACCDDRCKRAISSFAGSGVTKPPGAHDNIRVSNNDRDRPGQHTTRATAAAAHATASAPTRDNEIFEIAGCRHRELGRPGVGEDVGTPGDAIRIQILVGVIPARSPRPLRLCRLRQRHYDQRQRPRQQLACG